MVYDVIDGCFMKQKTAYEMCISDWSADVCYSVLLPNREKCGEQRYKNARKYCDDIRRMEFWMHFREDFRKQSVPAHHEKDAGLSEHHHQDNGRAEERRVGTACVSTCRSRWST